MADSFYQLDAEDMAWTCHAHPGVSYKSLRYDHEGKGGAVMVHLVPGASYPRYLAHGGQDVYVVDGELLLDGARMGRGSYVHVAAGASQRPHSDKGCVLFVSFPAEIEHLEHA